MTTTDMRAVATEPKRLRALASYDILDSEPEQAFDDITVVARQLCGTQASLISFVDRDRQWFKARAGFDRSETDLDSSVCRYALDAPDLLVIDDLSLDPRTAENPLVSSGPRLRFYAGAPIHAAGGECLGALCVLDPEPRPGGLTPAQADGLVRLARQVEATLELRRELRRRDDALAALPSGRDPDQQQLVTQELGHRLKNTLAIVQAIASQTLRPLDRVPYYAFESRLQALGAAHDVLLRRDWEAAALADVAEQVLSAFARRRLAIDGPGVELGSRATLSVSLVLHELATNAVKYGALASPDGHVSLSWRVEGERLTLDWRERGGPPPRPPERLGFGSKLLRAGLTGTGGAELRYDAEGFSATLIAPLTELRRG